MRNIYIRAGFKDIRAMAKSLVPALEVEIEFSISKSTPGEMIQVPDAAQGIILDHVQGFLFWNTAGDTDWLRSYLATVCLAPRGTRKCCETTNRRRTVLSSFRSAI